MVIAFLKIFFYIIVKLIIHQIWQWLITLKHIKDLKYLTPRCSNLYIFLKDIWSPDGEGSYYDFWKRYENISQEDDFQPEVVLSPGNNSFGACSMKN